MGTGGTRVVKNAEAPSRTARPSRFPTSLPITPPTTPPTNVPTTGIGIARLPRRAPETIPAKAPAALPASAALSEVVSSGIFASLVTDHHHGRGGGSVSFAVTTYTSYPTDRRSARQHEQRIGRSTQPLPLSAGCSATNSATASSAAARSASGRVMMPL